MKFPACNVKMPVIFAAAVLALSALTASAQSTTTPAQASEPGPDVRISVSVLNDTLAPGASSEIRILFTPAKGFHVNAVPAMALEFDSASPARADAGIVIPTDTATGYLEATLPVRQPFTLPKRAGRGPATLEGTLIFYYCSDAEGWCRRERMRFVLPVVVR